MKGAHEHARRKAAASASHGRHEREASRGRDCETFAGMKGWRPSAIPKGSKPVRALLRAKFLLDIGSIGLSFSAGPWAHGPCGPGSLFALIGSAAARSAQMASERSRSKNGASPSTCFMRPQRTEMRQKVRQTTRGEHAHCAAPPPGPGAAQRNAPGSAQVLDKARFGQGNQS